MAGLQRHMLDMNYSAPKFLDRSNSDFRPIHGACDSEMTQLIVTQSFMLMKFHLIILFTYKIHC